MKIGIIGTGNMGRGFAQAFSTAGHEVVVGSRDPEKAKQVAAETGAAGAGSYQEAVRDADVVVLTVPWMAAEETVRELAEDLRSTVLLDVTNPYLGKELQPLQGTSTAEEIQKWAPGSRVVKGWNHVFSPILTNPDYDGVAASVAIAADYQEAKDTVIGLARDIGFDPVDVGPLESTRELERLQRHLGVLGLWPDGALKVLKR